MNQGIQSNSIQVATPHRDKVKIITMSSPDKEMIRQSFSCLICKDLLLNQGIQVATPHKDTVRIITLSSPDKEMIRQSFSCLICKDLLHQPVVSTCCNSLLACRNCLEQWFVASTQCPKCKAMGK